MALNEIILIGRLTKDVETQNINDTLNARFTLAVDRSYKAKGEDKPQADFIPVTVWRKSAEFAEKYFKKGKQVYVVGSLETYSYEKDGEKRFAFRVSASKIGFADTAKAESNADTGNAPDRQFAANPDTGFTPTDFSELDFSDGIDEFSDDLPFG